MEIREIAGLLLEWLRHSWLPRRVDPEFIKGFWNSVLIFYFGSAPVVAVSFFLLTAMRTSLFSWAACRRFRIGVWTIAMVVMALAETIIYSTMVVSNAEEPGVVLPIFCAVSALFLFCLYELISAGAWRKRGDSLAAIWVRLNLALLPLVASAAVVEWLEWRARPFRDYFFGIGYWPGVFAGFSLSMSIISVFGAWIVYLPWRNFGRTVLGLAARIRGLRRPDFMRRRGPNL